MLSSCTKAEIFINEFKSFSNKQLHNELDISRIIETIFKMDRFQLLEDIAFISKYCSGIYNLLQDRNPEVKEEYWKDLTQNFSESIETFKTKLKEVIHNFEEMEKLSFETRYFEMHHASFGKLLSLIEDFTELKLFLNARKRSH